MLRPHIAPFELTAGVPMGGLHVATAFALVADVPLIYPVPKAENDEAYEEIEGIYVPGQTVLLVDDLITGGSSIVTTAQTLRTAGLMVHDAVVLLDRQAGAAGVLNAAGVHLHALLSFETLLNYLRGQAWITPAQFAQCMTYLEQSGRALGGASDRAATGTLQETADPLAPRPRVVVGLEHLQLVALDEILPREEPGRDFLLLDQPPQALGVDLEFPRRLNEVQVVVERAVWHATDHLPSAKSPTQI